MATSAQTALSINPLPTTLPLFSWEYGRVSPTLLNQANGTFNFALSYGRQPFINGFQNFPTPVAYAATPAPEALAEAYTFLNRLKANPLQLQNIPGQALTGQPPVTSTLTNRGLGFLNATLQPGRGVQSITVAPLASSAPALPERLSLLPLAVSNYASAAKAQAVLNSGTFKRMGLTFNVVGNGPMVVSNEDGTWSVVSTPTDGLTAFRVKPNSLNAQEELATLLNAGPEVTNAITTGLQRNPQVTIDFKNLSPKALLALQQALKEALEQQQTTKSTQNNPEPASTGLQAALLSKPSPGNLSKGSKLASPQALATSTNKANNQAFSLKTVQTTLLQNNPALLGVSLQANTQLTSAQPAEDALEQKAEATETALRSTTTETPAAVPIWKRMDGFIPLQPNLFGASALQTSKTAEPTPVISHPTLQADVMEKRSNEQPSPLQRFYQPTTKQQPEEKEALTKTNPLTGSHSLKKKKQQGSQVSQWV